VTLMRHSAAFAARGDNASCGPRFNALPRRAPTGSCCRITTTGHGDNLEYWNRYVAVTQKGEHGTFTEKRMGVGVTNGSASRLRLAIQPPPRLRPGGGRQPAPSALSRAFEALQAGPGWPLI
jgi:hypothetical protein